VTEYDQGTGTGKFNTPAANVPARNSNAAAVFTSAQIFEWSREGGPNFCGKRDGLCARFTANAPAAMAQLPEGPGPPGAVKRP
jgi:hypothetical protein